MGAAQPNPTLTLDAFLIWESGQAERHEYLRGEVFAITGAGDAHNTVAGNLFAYLCAALRGGPCRVFIAHMKLRVDAADAVFYPDLMVTCDARDRGP
jgi:Uma2 family endonuclease